MARMIGMRACSCNDQVYDSQGLSGPVSPALALNRRMSWSCFFVRSIQPPQSGRYARLLSSSTIRRSTRPI